MDVGSLLDLWVAATFVGIAIRWLVEDLLWSDVSEILTYADEVIVYQDCTVVEYVEQYCDDTDLLRGLPWELRCYFDYESFARDMELEGSITTFEHHVIANPMEF